MTTPPFLSNLSHLQVTQVKLPYQLAAIDPTIDAKTMDFHFNTHYKAYVDNLNKATATAAPSVKASDLSSKCMGKKTVLLRCA
jgi:Fe-Mn family superoxide dismutase